ncbi:PLP-dependent aminotransferase family protein [Paenibacillus sp. GCM10027626]|uniref:aminotransferase-like domain-containing protein n=1 Tax=Paenibacillus sp. GCM10027626 TaxID=3273411 RepID=UPI00363386CD
MLKYMQLFHELEANIKNSTFKQGGKLPSIRALSEQYSCSKSTVLAALEELERRHMIYSVPKSGYYVVQTSGRGEKSGNNPIDFAASAPDPDLFPYLDFQHCINKAIDMYKNDLFIYGTPRGLPSLLTVMRHQLADSQVFTEERNIIITSGVQMALALLAAIPFPNGKKNILIEQPGYHLFIDHLLTHQVPVEGIYRTAKGIDLDQLEQLFRTRDIKFFYTIPRFHTPLGTSYAERQKKEIVTLAQKYDVYLVEDDHLADLEQNSKADPLFSYDQDARVIYLKSYSKIIFPGLRIGVAVLPEALVEIFTRYKRSIDIDSSMLSQGALEIYIKSGMFARHREKIREAYISRARKLDESLRREALTCEDAFTFPALKYPSIHTHLVLDKRLSVPGIIKQLKNHNVLLEPLDKHYLPGYLQNHLLKLNASHVQEANIEAGIMRLASILSKEMSKHQTMRK